MATYSRVMKSHGQRSLAGYGPWDHKESDTTEQIYYYYKKSLGTRSPRQRTEFSV